MKNPSFLERDTLIIQSCRVGLYLILFVLILANHLFQDGFYDWALMKSFFGVAFTGVLLHAIPLFSLKKYFSLRPVVFASFVVDVALVSFLLLQTGLNQALFLFLYLVNIILAGLVFRMRGAVFIAALTSIGFSFVSIMGPDIKAMAFVFLMIMNNLAFFAVGGLAGYLSDQLSFFVESLRAKNLTLSVVQKLNNLIIKTAPFGLLSLNSDGEILQSNPSLSELLNDKSLVGKKCYEVFPDILVGFRSSQRTQRPLTIETSLFVQGQDLLLRLQLFPQESSALAEKTYLLVVENLTEVRKLELAARQSEKMAAVGQLAAGIAHEIRNPLAGISGSIELLSQKNETEEDKKLSKIILREIDRLNNLITEFLDYSRPEKPPTEKVDLSKLLKEILQSVKLGEKKSVLFKDDLQAVQVLGHEPKLRQAFLNIIVNALQAMEKAPNPELKVSCRKSGNEIIVAIKDNGIGMSAETQKRMFEPFHTTKPKGTGLGLAVTHKILEAHRAAVSVQSQVGLGTEFLISFPANSIENQSFAVEN